jgi:hypothetical protein
MGNNTLIYDTNLGSYEESKNIMCWVYRSTMLWACARPDILPDLVWNGRYCSFVRSSFIFLRQTRMVTSLLCMEALREILHRKPYGIIATFVWCLQVVPNEGLLSIFWFQTSEEVTRGQIRRVRWFFQNLLVRNLFAVSAVRDGTFLWCKFHIRFRRMRCHKRPKAWTYYGLSGWLFWRNGYIMLNSFNINNSAIFWHPVFLRVGHVIFPFQTWNLVWYWNTWVSSPVIF